MPSSKLLKAYDNSEFLHSPAARNLRVLSEFEEPEHRFRKAKVRDTIVFFGSARSIPSAVAKERLAEVESRKPVKGTAHEMSMWNEEVIRAQHAVKLGRYHDDGVTLARMMTEWSKSIPGRTRRFIVCTGGGPGMMMAANQGASEADGHSVGLNISLPFEQEPNPFITDHLNFEFHYFFIRKYWFAYLAKAMVVLPGGFGTCDELFEILTMVQTKKTRKDLPFVVYGRDFWRELIDFEAMVRWGVVSEADMGLFKIMDSPEEAYEYLTTRLTQIYL